MLTHKWHLEVTERGRRDIRKLPSSDRRAVFNGIRELLEAENPKLVQNVKKLMGSHFEGQYRLRQGDYRIFFLIEAGEHVHMKFTYKGKIIILAIPNRKEAY